jgi:hypothetical protein
MVLPVVLGLIEVAKLALQLAISPEGQEQLKEWRLNRPLMNQHFAAIVETVKTVKVDKIGEFFRGVDWFKG